MHDYFFINDDFPEDSVTDHNTSEDLRLRYHRENRYYKRKEIELENPIYRVVRVRGNRKNMPISRFKIPEDKFDGIYRIGKDKYNYVRGISTEYKEITTPILVEEIDGKIIYNAIETKLELNKTRKKSEEHTQEDINVESLVDIVLEGENLKW